MRRNSSSEDGSTEIERPGSAGLFGKLLEPGRVVCNAEARSRKQALEIMSELLSEADIDLSRSEVFDSLIAREKLGRTGLAGGVAVPHGRIAGISDNLGAFLKLVRPVPYDTPDNQGVDLIFGIIVPADSPADPSADMAALVTALSDAEFCAALRGTKSSRDLYELLIEQPDPPIGDEHLF